VTITRLRSHESVTVMPMQTQQVKQEMYQNKRDVNQKQHAPQKRRYAKLYQTQHGLDMMRSCGLQAPVDPDFNTSTTYAEATSTMIEALQVMGPEYSEIMEKGINERWVDRADNIGKSTGAFCSSPYGVHPYILVTWTDTMRGAFILAHELGHAGHFYL